MATLEIVTNFGGLRSLGPCEQKSNVIIPFWHIYQWYPNPKALSLNSIWIPYFTATQYLDKQPVFTEALELKSEPRVWEQDAWITWAGCKIYLPPWGHFCSSHDGQQLWSIMCGSPSPPGEVMASLPQGSTPNFLGASRIFMVRSLANVYETQFRNCVS